MEALRSLPVSTYPAIFAANMNDQQRAIYYAQLSVVQKDEVLGVLLAVFLGTFGAHHFYMRRTGLGILYCLLSVTGFSSIAGLVEAFFMPERVRRFNAAQAGAIASNLGFYHPGVGGSVASPGLAPGGGFAPQPGYSPVGVTTAAVAVGNTGATAVPCSSCGASVAAGVNFCSRCGAAMHSAVAQA